MELKRNFASLSIILFIFTASFLYAQDTRQTSNNRISQSSYIPIFQSFDSSLIEPAVLAKTLSDSLAAKPVILHVGVPFQFKNAHIPGAKHTGMASTPDGIEALDKLEKLPTDTTIIIYCGCCPWKDCPNIRPAFRELQQSGFTKVYTLHISTNFQKDWIDKKYPVEKSN